MSVSPTTSCHYGPPTKGFPVTPRAMAVSSATRQLKRKAQGVPKALKNETLKQNQSETETSISVHNHPGYPDIPFDQIPRTLPELHNLRTIDEGGESDQDSVYSTSSDSFYTIHPKTDKSGSTNTSYPNDSRCNLCSNSRYNTPSWINTDNIHPLIPLRDHSKLTELLLPHREDRGHSITDKDILIARGGESSSGSNSTILYQQAEDLQSDAMSDLSTPSFSLTTSQSKTSHPATSCFSDYQDNRLTDHKTSFQSETASNASNAAADFSPTEAASDTVEGVIYNALRDDPQVAKLLVKLVEGKLDLVQKGNMKKDFHSGDLLTALNVNNVDDSNSIWHHGVFKYCPSSDPSSASASSSANNPKGAKNSSNSSGSNSGNVFGSPNNKLSKDSFEDAGSGELTKQQKGKSVSGVPVDGEPHGLRCFHNAALPETFCPNHSTGNAFRSCAGAGWLKFAHLKDHMCSHHRKKTYEFRCSNCQQDFENEELLKNHTMRVDCVICCPECEEKFAQKSMRTSHQEEMHSNGGRSVTYMELDDDLWKILKDKLKAFTDSIKRGSATIDPELLKWVAKNTPRYEQNRDATASPLHDLGQWYITFHTLNFQADIPDHPFYDFFPPVELVLAKSRMIFSNLLEAKIRVHGFPAQDPQCLDNYVSWHTANFEETLDIARNTQIRINGKSQFAEGCSEAENQNTTTYSQITMPPSGASNELRTVIPSDTIIPHPQQPAIQQLPRLGYHQNVFTGNQTDFVSGAVGSSSNPIGMFSQQIYPQQNSVAPLPGTAYPYFQNQRYDCGVDYYPAEHPYPNEDQGNWDMQLSGEHWQ